MVQASIGSLTRLPANRTFGDRQADNVDEGSRTETVTESGQAPGKNQC